MWSLSPQLARLDTGRLVEDHLAADLSAGTYDIKQGRIVTSGDPDYDFRRATFDGMIDRRPVEIHLCADVAGVVASVRRSRDLGLPISVRGGGHGLAGHCIGEGSLMVDLGGMRNVTVDPVARTAVAQGGATWEDYDIAKMTRGVHRSANTSPTWAMEQNCPYPFMVRKVCHSPVEMQVQN